MSSAGQSGPSTGDFARMDGASYRSRPYDGGADWSADLAARKYAANPNGLPTVASSTVTVAAAPDNINGLDLPPNYSSGVTYSPDDEARGGAILRQMRDREIDGAAAAARATTLAQARFAEQGQYAARMSGGSRGGSGSGYDWPVIGRPSLDSLTFTASPSTAGGAMATFSMNGGGANVTLRQTAAGLGELAVSGAVNAASRIVGGAVSIGVLALDGVSGAVAYQDAVHDNGWKPQSVGAQAIANSLAPLAQAAGAGIQYGHDFSANLIGDGATTLLFTGAQFGLEAIGTAYGLRGMSGIFSSVTVEGLAARALDSLSEPRLHPQFGGVLIDSGMASARGPRVLVAREAVNLEEFKRLNVLDTDVARFRPGEAGAAAELQTYMGGTLNRAPVGTGGDFVFSSGQNSGKIVDFMLTPDTFSQATKINHYFEKNLAGFSKTLDLHLEKADFVPMDTRFLSGRNNQLLNDMINKLSPQQQAKVVLIR